MSKATDNFPWEYQKTVLNMVMNTRDSYTRELVGLLTSTVERGQWHLDSGRNLRRCRWSKGQPLGLGPSFPLFALTHGLVLFTLNEGRWDQTFYVLGDDVIILDDDLADKYKKWLSTVHVNISEQKTFSSNAVGQFAGKTYTPHGAFWVPKWVEFTKDNVLDVCSWWFPGLSEIFPKDRKTIDWVLSLPSPLGNGWNPSGLSLDDRLHPHVVDMMLERDEQRKAKAIPSSSECRLSTIHTAMRVAGLNALASYDASGLVIEKWRATSHTTSVTTSVPQVRYAPETEVPGYPSIRFHGARVDPYSKGRLSVWKHMLKMRPQSQD
jgi:ribosomal protein L27